MSNFWTYGKFVDWSSCIDSNRLCNLRTCPDTMNCCVTNCMGTPTFSGILFGFLMAGIVFLALSIIMKYSSIKKVEE